MALIERSRRVSRSEYTRDYYRAAPAASAAAPFSAPPAVSHEPPHAPPVPPRRPGQVGRDPWVPAPPINPAVWRASHQAKLHQARVTSSESQRTRDENRRVCEETEQLTAKHRAEVERRLDDRVCDVTFWRDELGARHTVADQDATDLKVIRDRLLKAHHLYLRPLEVARQCIDIRRGRVGVEEVEDEAATALRQEVEELLRCRDALARALHNTEQQIRRVLSCRYHLNKNLVDKDAALGVEESTARLTPSAPPTAIIPAQTVDPSPVTVDSWRDIGVRLLARADAEHELSTLVRAASEDVLAAAARTLRERLAHTDHCLRERVADTRRAKTLLEEQHAKVVEEESQLGQSLVEVEDQLEAKRGPLALAQTRLRTRLARPNMERTRDEVEAALLREVEELELSVSRLGSAAALSRDQLQLLRASRVSLEHDINLKANTLLLDETKVLDLRNTVTIDSH